MRNDILEVIKQHKHEIVVYHDLFEEPCIRDWFHYLDDCVLNVHDYDEDKILSINAYRYDSNDNTDWENMFLDEKMTLEEFNKL